MTDCLKWNRCCTFIQHSYNRVYGAFLQVSSVSISEHSFIMTSMHWLCPTPYGTVRRHEYVPNTSNYFTRPLQLIHYYSVEMLWSIPWRLWCVQDHCCWCLSHVSLSRCCWLVHHVFEHPMSFMHVTAQSFLSSIASPACDSDSSDGMEAGF